MRGRRLRSPPMPPCAGPATGVFAVRVITVLRHRTRDRHTARDRHRVRDRLRHAARDRLRRPPPVTAAPASHP